MSISAISSNNCQTNKIHYSKVSNPNKSLWENKTSINGEMDFFQQAIGAEDCQILSDLIGLKHTTWGKKIFKENVKPDGMGGAIVTLNGAKGNKDITISVEELIKAKSNPRIVKGDDDIIALELAMVKYIKREGGEIPENIIHGRVFHRNNIEGNIITLLCGDNYIEKSYDIENDIENYSSKTQIKKLLIDAKDCTLQTCFKEEYHDCRLKDFTIQGYHAYTLKSFSNDEVVIIDPFDAKKEIKLSFDDFYFFADSVSITGKKDLLTKKEFKRYYKKQTELKKYNDSKEKITKILRRHGFSILTERNLNSLSNIDKYTLTRYYPNQVITHLDGLSLKSENKHKLIDPLIDAVIEQAKYFEIDEQSITTFRETCNKEMDAFFYTDEKVIIQAFNKINKMIEEKKNEYFDGVYTRY